MGFIQRLERNIAKLEKRIQKEGEKIASLQQKYESHKITPAEFNLKKRKIDDHIRDLNSRLRVLQGGIAKEKRLEEERKEEKKKKKEEKEEKKKEKQKKKEK